MLRISGALAAALLLATPAFANAAPPPPTEAATIPPEIFIKSVYDTKLETQAISPEFGAAMNDSVVLSHFTPELLALYKAAIDAGEPIVDGDVFWDAQDWDDKIEVATATTANDGKTATVEASFKILGQDRKITFALKALREGWQIDDITGASGSLRKWLTEGVAAMAPPK
jgi:hypothetical protein